MNRLKRTLQFCKVLFYEVIKIEGDKIEFKKSYEDENHETKWWIYKGEVKEITDKSLVLEMKHDLNEDGTDDILTFTFYRK